MTAPSSPALSSSTYSCLSDSEISNDSGIDFMSSVSFPEDYMNLDEFLIATGEQCYPSNITTVQIQGNRLSPQFRKKQKKRKDMDENLKVDDSEENQKDIKTSQTKRLIRKRQMPYSYKYNPIPMGKKAIRTFVPDQEKDDCYWRRRERNNDAAQRSRDMRREREIEISLKLQKLEEENERLKKELQKLKNRATELERQLLEKQ